MKRKIPKPTEAELSILRILWANGPSSVRYVHEQLQGERSETESEKRYTTTLKLMQLMVEKGLARRNTDQRVHIYEAGVAEKDVQASLLRRFVDTTFGGSAASLVMRALGQHQPSAEELEEIKRLIERMEGKQQPPKP